MDLQELVDRRITELRLQSEPNPPTAAFRGSAPPRLAPGEREDMPGAAPAGLAPQRRYADREAGATAATGPAAPQELAQFAEIVDAALAGMAGRMLEMTEQLAGDCARLEKNILKARLDTLQTVESVMDIAISLRREARAKLETIGDELRRQTLVMAAAEQAGLAAASDSRDDGNGSRASMHEGMAALFKRTR